MRITVLYFAAAREAAGLAREVLDPAPATVGALRQALATAHPPLARLLPRCRLAVDQDFADDAAPLTDGAEVALIPPVAGGSPLYRVVDRPLRLDEVVEAVSGPERGAVVTFTGTVRSQTRGRAVTRLEYEAYLPMAEKTLAAIGDAVGAEQGALVAVVHRIGVLQPGEAAVVIAAAAAHRAPAFRACQATIERLKQEAPIWKREVYQDGSEWVGLGP